MNWTIRNTNANIPQIAHEFNISQTFATIIANRNILTAFEIKSYLSSNISFLHDPLLMKDMEKAFTIILNIIQNQDLICIYGDYDVDGITSTTILYKGLKSLGANVMFYIPDREEGYGLNIETIKKIKNNEDVQLFLTCDNGISNIEEIKYIKDNGMQIIVIDHHEPRFHEQDGERFDIIPIADAIINPKQSKCSYPYEALCAGAICFKFIQALYNYMDLDPDILKPLTKSLNEYIIFASISTICDIVDLTDENRIIVKLGLKVLNSNKKMNLGLYYLMQVNNIHEKVITEYDYGFILGPCINASGRLEKATRAVELFTAEDPQEALLIAEELYNLNMERKEITSNAVEDVFKELEELEELEKLEELEELENSNQKVLVIYRPDIHESIAGIVAGKIKEAKYKPTIIITNSIDSAKGSGRSIPSYNMFEELLKCEHLFTKFGGHKMAAGLSMQIDNIDEFRNLINNNCTLQDEDFIEVISIDKQMSFSDIDLNLAKELKLMQPIGKDNRGATFATKSVSIDSLRIVGKNKNILQFSLKDKTNKILKAISFSGYDNFIKLLSTKYNQSQIEEIISENTTSIDLIIDIVYSIDINIYKNYENVQLILKDFRLN